MADQPSPAAVRMREYASSLWSRCPDHSIPWHLYAERARAVYWNNDFTACRAKGSRNAVCLLDPGHEGQHYGNGFDNYGPLGASRWGTDRGAPDSPGGAA